MIIEVQVNGRFYWYRLKSKNGHILATSEGYGRKRDANRAARRLAALVPGARLKLAA